MGFWYLSSNLCFLTPEPLTPVSDFFDAINKFLILDFFYTDFGVRIQYMVPFFRSQYR